ncbi:hypothetical protein KY284_026513 [Solanum tuberosum]|nr:hypothetical protein KY284_026513 [Solanum tuberosum]
MTCGLDTHLFVGTTMISMYAECGFVEFAWKAIAYFRGSDVSGADKVFGLLPFRNLTTWNVMLAGYTKAGELERAEGELVGSGSKPNEVSLTVALSACAQAGAFKFGMVLHSFIEKVGLVWISSVNNALLDTYSKCGNVLMARLVFERMLGKKTIVSWTSMIAGLAMQGYGHELFSKMAETYDIEPTIEHYGCMVDFYGRAGQLRKAYNFVVQMPVPPNAVIWRTLLGACSFLGDIEMAEQVNKRLSELDPDNCGDHVLLSSIYTFAGKWKDVAMVRRSMAEKDMKKIPGWSMIEIDKVMYSFVAGDKQNEITEEAYNKLSEIMLKLKVKGGYIPEVGSVLHDIEEEEKEDTVSKHSEKLAVAFGMARLCKGSTIRIVKNLRVCKDCHSFMKLISKVYGLEIVDKHVGCKQKTHILDDMESSMLAIEMKENGKEVVKHVCQLIDLEKATASSSLQIFRRSGPGTIKTIIERLSIVMNPPLHLVLSRVLSAKKGHSGNPLLSSVAAVTHRRAMFHGSPKRSKAAMKAHRETIRGEQLC